MVRYRRIPLLAVLPLVACQDAPTTPLSQDGPATVTAASAVGPIHADEDGIQGLIDASEAAWAAKDATAYAASYHPDVDFVNPVGGVVVGREAVRAQHVFLFTTLFAGSTSEMVVRRLEFLTGTLAQVDLNVTLTGFAALPPGLPQAEPGVVRTRVRWIVVKRAGDWQILSQQMTALPPGAQF